MFKMKIIVFFNVFSGVKMKKIQFIPKNRIEYLEINYRS